MKKMFIIFLTLLPVLYISCKENKIDSVQIMYYPRCKDKTVKIIIYDNESAAFTDLMIKKINNAFFDPFYIPCKDLLDEGWYQIFLNSNGNIREYVLDSQDTIYDVKFHKNLRSNILSDIYVYIAKSHLNQLAGNVNE